MIIIPESQLEPIEHLRWSFFAKTTAFNYFRRKFYLRCLIAFDQYASEFATVSFSKKLDEMRNSACIPINNT